jgi:acyl-CoA oxidase
VRAVLRRGDVRDRDYQRRLLVAREEHLLASAAQRMRKAMAPGADQFRIVNDAQTHLLDVARAYVDRIVFDAFAATVDRVADADARSLLGQVLGLYALSTIEGNRAFFVEHSYLTPGRAKVVTRAVNALCGKLRPHARTLVDGFGIPETWLECPLLQAGSLKPALVSAP